jgi:hypothetical protein
MGILELEMGVASSASCPFAADNKTLSTHLLQKGVYVEM